MGDKTLQVDRDVLQGLSNVLAAIAETVKGLPSTGLFEPAAKWVGVSAVGAAGKEIDGVVGAAVGLMRGRVSDMSQIAAQNRDDYAAAEARFEAELRKLRGA
ncbi:hypothetical protein G4X40_05055 [Rhodococcus sp. D2-41]|uniref:Uncharacterized protein n=1 Tax=Speluncibacter jeojiensis TaxID=2710754 RepID=A0A9X4M1T4_9ACTN|nr:hypothetical protein [Rhodococcus sp. D2-41]MDG3009511.1 hypothetical protein [Rhodococcus sp. D2-41]MDG3016440.1 hypothetical protein [Corynebacteriales bacterium D3-21]